MPTTSPLSTEIDTSSTARTTLFATEQTAADVEMLDQVLHLQERLGRAADIGRWRERLSF